MPRYIDADALMKEFIDFVRDSNNSDFAPVPNWNDAVSLVGSAQTADVQEVVRCRDCKYGIEWDERLCCEWHGFYSTEPEWYCSDGERKETDG